MLPAAPSVTKRLRSLRTPDLTVYLTRRNMFGPLHGIARKVDVVGPDDFLRGDSGEYVLLNAGLTNKPYITIEE